MLPMMISTCTCNDIQWLPLKFQPFTSNCQRDQWAPDHPFQPSFSSRKSSFSSSIVILYNLTYFQDLSHSSSSLWSETLEIWSFWAKIHHDQDIIIYSRIKNILYSLRISLPVTVIICLRPIPSSMIDNSRNFVTRSQDSSWPKLHYVLSYRNYPLFAY